MKYKDFSDEFLVAAYKESRLRPGKTLCSGDIIDRYPLTFEPGWVVQLVRDLGTRGYLTSKGVDTDDRGQPIRLTGRGLRVAEDLIEKGVGIFRLDLGDGVGFPPAEDKSVKYEKPGSVSEVRHQRPSAPLILPSPLRPTPIAPTGIDWAKWGTIAAWVGIPIAFASLIVSIIW